MGTHRPGGANIDRQGRHPARPNLTGMAVARRWCRQPDLLICDWVPCARGDWWVWLLSDGQPSGDVMIDGVIPEPPEGAHTDLPWTSAVLKRTFLEELTQLATRPQTTNAAKYALFVALMAKE